jgi:hypothetical protein
VEGSNKELIPCVLEVMVGDEIQWLLGLLKIFIERPKNISQIKLFGRSIYFQLGHFASLTFKDLLRCQ